MTDLAPILQQSAAHAWLFVPSAILLGALHGLEPGHSKTMMAAFIIAIRGTVLQATLLGLSATISHTAIVWAVALGGLYLGREWNGEQSEAYFQVASAVLIIGIAAWMAWRTWREQNAGHDHDHPHDHDHHHHPHDHDRHHDHEGHHHHDHDHGHHHESDHAHSHMNLGDEGDAHARAHAADIRKRFAGRNVTTWQIVLFGLTGGLIPCPAAITVLLLCLQLKQFSLGFTLVVCFGIGLAITMVSAGVLAALSLRHIERRWSSFSHYARQAPYASAALIVLVGLYTGWLGLKAI
jgi:nickel/cobalt transporter (NicO) family protein